MKKVLKFVTILFFVALFLGTIVFLWSKTQPKVITYELIGTARETLTEKTVATGKIEPRDEVLIKPQISGIISKVYAEAGQMIKAGDVIAQVTVIPEMGALNNAEARVRMAKINLEQVQKEYDRINTLFEKGVATKEEFEKSETSLKSSKEDLLSAKDNLEIVQKGMISRSSALSNTQIRATVTGMILDVPVKVGNSVILSNTFNDGTTIAVIADLNDMLFVGDVDETEVGKLKEGMKAEIIVGALQALKMSAELEYISPKASELDGVVVFQIKAATSIPDTVLIRSGYSANASIITSEKIDVLSIPESVVSFKDGKSFVEILTSAEEVIPQVFEKKEVELGFSNGINVEVISGLEGTEKMKGNIKPTK